MAKWRTVAAHEYSQNLRRKGFLGTTIGFPLLLIVAFGLIAFFITRGEAPKGLGYVDQSGITSQMAEQTVITDTISPDVTLIRYASEEQARADTTAKTIDGYVVISADYLTTGMVQAYSNDGDLPDVSRSAFNRFLQKALIQTVPNRSATRLEKPLKDVLSRTVDGTREVRRNEGFLLFFVPYLFGIFLIVSIFASSSYLMTAVVEEKENRVMEILSSSMKPLSLMAGKIVGLGLLGLTQVAVWTISVIGLLQVARAQFPIIATLSLPVDVMLFALAMFIPTYLLVGAALSAIGAAVTAVQEGQQLSGFVSILMWAPMLLIPLIVAQPNSPLVVALSMAPFTAPLVMMQRMALVGVPFWQLVGAIMIQGIAAIGMIWIAGKVLEIGMLRYGKRLSLRDVLGVVRRKEVASE